MAPTKPGRAEQPQRTRKKDGQPLDGCEDSVAGKLHRAVPDPAHLPGTQCETAAEVDLGHGWTCEPTPRSSRIDSRRTNAVLAV